MAIKHLWVKKSGLPVCLCHFCKNKDLAKMLTVPIFKRRQIPNGLIFRTFSLSRKQKPKLFGLCWGEKRTNEIEPFLKARWAEVEFTRTMPWLKKGLLKMNLFWKPDEQRSSLLELCHGSKKAYWKWTFFESQM